MWMPATSSALNGVVIPNHPQYFHLHGSQALKSDRFARDPHQTNAGAVRIFYSGSFRKPTLTSTGMD